MGELEGDREAVSSIAISLDGKWLASGRSDGTILLWAIGSDVVSVEPKGKQFITLGDLKHTMLLQNYPNPFNPETWIPFVLGEAADVEIRIYSANSNQARTLHLGQKEIGMGQTTPEKQSQAASTLPTACRVGDFCAKSNAAEVSTHHKTIDRFDGPGYYILVRSKTSIGNHSVDGVRCAITLQILHRKIVREVIMTADTKSGSTGY